MLMSIHSVRLAQSLMALATATDEALATLRDKPTA